MECCRRWTVREWSGAVVAGKQFQLSTLYGIIQVKAECTQKI